MTRKLYKQKQGQISTEIMYTVGVMILLFLLMTGVAVDRRSELRKAEDYLQKKDECLKVADTIASLTASGYNTRALITLHYPMHIYPDGRIMISPDTNTETPCTYVGNLNPLQVDSSTHYISLAGGNRDYCFFAATFNQEDRVGIFDTDTSDVIVSTCAIFLCQRDDPNLFLSWPAPDYAQLCKLKT